MSEPKTYMNLIGGEWVPSQSGTTYANVNPADTRDVVGLFQDSNADDVDAAVRAAAAAYEGWRLTPAPKRGEILFRAAELLVERKEALRPDDDPRDGQGAQRSAWRCAGSHRHDLLHRG